ncbi:MAG: hypothetical protein KDB03_06790 [Planctomycetales bacterium]|nr:hypothetical protein [Planctomycetales bacterium]
MYPLKLKSLLMIVVATYLVALCQAEAQQYDLRADNLGARSRAVINDHRLEITGSDGQNAIYQRDKQFDSTDGQWLAYSGASQIVRWPLTSTGNLQIGRRVGGAIEYRKSQMQIFPTAELSLNNASVLPTSPNNSNRIGLAKPQGRQESITWFEGLLNNQDNLSPQFMRLASVDSNGSPWLMARSQGLGLQSVRGPLQGQDDWWIAPVGSFVRLQTNHLGIAYALSAQPSGMVTLAPLTQDAHQLWRVLPANSGAGQFVFENVQLAGRGLALTPSGPVLQPLAVIANQGWLPIIVPQPVGWEPVWRSVNREVRPNPPLPPAQLELANSHRFALFILLADNRRLNSVEQIRIEPQSSTIVSVDRDPGATIFETYELRSPSGIWKRDQSVTPIPATSYYDVSVYEEHLQSIAIDRTGKSPNMIEDVNYVPKSVGWLKLPANLPDAGRIAIYEQASAAKNPGAVRRLDPRSFDKGPNTGSSSLSPLEQLLQELAPPSRKSF